MTGKIFCCRYAGRTEGWRYESWREEFGRKWVTADFSSLTDDYVVSELRSSRHSFVALGSMRGTPLRMERRGDVVEHERGDWFLILASGCRMRAFQRGRSVELSGGDLTLLSGDGPASLTQLTEGSRWSIRIPQRPIMRLDNTCSISWFSVSERRPMPRTLRRPAVLHRPGLGRSRPRFCGAFRRRTCGLCRLRPISV